MPGPITSALLGAGSGLLSKGLDFGLGVASSKMQYEMTRDLRRREYQDMMHSMRKAGLNPILASGATPGHSAVQAPDTGGPTDLQGSIASAQESGRRQNLNESEKTLLGAQTTTALAGAEKAKQDAAASRYLMESQRLELEARARNLGASADLTSGAETAATWGLADLRGVDTKLRTAQVQTEGLAQGLIAKQTISEGARAALMGDQAALAQMDTTLAEARVALTKIEQTKMTTEEKRIAFENVKRGVEAEWMRGPVGRNLEKFNLAASQILGPIGDLLKMRPSSDKPPLRQDGRRTDPRPGRAPYKY